MDSPTTEQRRGGSIIKNIYLYLVSFVALMMIIFSTADLLNIALKTFVFTKADDNYYYGPVACPIEPSSAVLDNKGGQTPSSSPLEKGRSDCQDTAQQRKQNDDMRSAQRQRDLVRDISMIIVAIPVFLYHWKIVRNKEEGN